MATGRLKIILSQYCDKRPATQQFLNQIKDNRKKGFELTNTIHNQPMIEQLVWASRLLLDNSGVSVSNDDISNEEFQAALLEVFKVDHPLLEDAKLFLGTVTSSDRLKS